jgi:hypothetical protein
LKFSRVFNFGLGLVTNEHEMTRKNFDDVKYNESSFDFVLFLLIYVSQTTFKLDQLPVKKMDKLKQAIKNLAEIYSANLKSKIEARREEMKADDNSHYLLYRVLGISTSEGQLIEKTQRLCVLISSFPKALKPELKTLSDNVRKHLR